MEEIVVDNTEVPDEDDEEFIDEYEDNVEMVGEEEEDDKSTSLNQINPDSVIDTSSFCFTGHKDAIYCIAIHPLQQSNLFLSGGGDDKAYLWDISNGSNNSSSSRYEFQHNDTVSSVGFNFDGTLCLTGGYDGYVKIWDVVTGELKQNLEGPEDIEWAQWHSKGNAVIAGSRDGTIWMWMATDGSCLQVFAGHEGGVSQGCFSKDGKLVCSGGEDGTVRLWAPKTGICKHVFASFDAHQALITSIDSSNDGLLLLTGKVTYIFYIFY